MTQAKGTPVPDGIKFDMVEETHVISGGANRSEAALVVKVSGHSRSNTETKDRVIELVEAAAVNREKFRLSYGVNKDLGVIALYIASWETKGAMPVRVFPNGLSFHIGGVFRKYPSLRPNTTVEPEITATTDADGRRCLAFNILAALPKQKTRKSKKDNSNTDTQTTAAEE
ncbi:MAG TPA: hypothetical protein VGK74_00375 [Symbiobacteriaceae bacterium]|jgi:hypothetical protein